MTEEKKVGYAILHIVDYGRGTQLQITSNLPVGATKQDFDAELDKIRLVTNRQKAFVAMRDAEAMLGAELKMAAAIEASLGEREKESNNAIAELKDLPKNTQHTEKQRLLGVVEGFRHFKANTMAEVQKHRTNAEIAQATIDGAKKEINGE